MVSTAIETCLQPYYEDAKRRSCMPISLSPTRGIEWSNQVSQITSGSEMTSQIKLKFEGVCDHGFGRDTGFSIRLCEEEGVFEAVEGDSGDEKASG